MIRLDKLAADVGIGTRGEVKKMIRKGLLKVNGIVIKNPDYKVNAEDVISYLNQEFQYQKNVYYMLHKPAGVVSAREDRRDETVLHLLNGAYTKDVFPVGRLDKDTEGLLLLTNDGQLAHDLLSPRKHVDKTYFARIQGAITTADVIAFEEGLDIGEKKLTMPAELRILKSGDISEVEVVIREGKFHQIKRMFHALDKEVIYLKRIQMGSLSLDSKLELGNYRELTIDEINKLKGHK